MIKRWNWFDKIDGQGYNLWLHEKKSGIFHQFHLPNIPIFLLHCLQKTVNTLRPRQNGRHFADDIFNGIFLNENVWISIKFSLKFVPKGPINNIPALVQIMAWRRPGDKPLSGPMMVSLLTHICVTRPQRVKLWSFTHSYPIILLLITLHFCIKP